MRSVLITGSNGQLGISIKELEKNYPDLKLLFCSSKELDITNYHEVLRFFEANKPDYCINCAAYTDVEQAERKPEKAFLVNAEAVKNLAETCKSYKTILIQVSTDYVFDGWKEEPYKVGDKTNPINQYGKSKLKGEAYIQEILKEFFIVRTSWLYNKNHGKNFYRTVLEKAKKGEDLKITTEQTGCPTDTLNLARYLLNLIENQDRKFGLYHFTDGVAMTWYDFAKKILIENLLLDTAKLEKVKKYRTFAARPVNSVLSLEKLPI